MEEVEFLPAKQSSANISEDQLRYFYGVQRHSDFIL